jgi:homoserine/homoserine lactone efflux protein
MNWTIPWTTLSIFAGMEFVLCLTPGPAVLYVISSGLRAGARKSLASNAGILAANLVYFMLSATGVGALLVASYNLFFAVKWIGAAYLFFIGLRMLIGKASVIESSDKASADGDPVGGNMANSPAAVRLRGLFTGGLILQLSNPKAIVFFTALLPQFFDPHRAIAPQVAMLAVTSIIIEFCVLLAYGAAAGKASALARQPRYANWTNRIAGSLLIGAGAGLATLRRGG